MTGNVNYCVTVPTPDSEDDSDDNLPNLNIKSTAPGEIKQYVTRLPSYQVTGCYQVTKLPGYRLLQGYQVTRLPGHRLLPGYQVADSDQVTECYQVTS